MHVDYCMGDGLGDAAVWPGEPTLDVDADGVLDAIGLDFDGDGRPDDALADLDGDGHADHLVLDVGAGEARFTDDGSGTWAVAAQRGAALRWFGLDGVEATGGPLVDFDGDGQADDRLLDHDRDGLADRVLTGGRDGGRDDGRDGGRDGGRAYVDADGDGRWDLMLGDVDGDGFADSAGTP